MSFIDEIIKNTFELDYELLYNLELGEIYNLLNKVKLTDFPDKPEFQLLSQMKNFLSLCDEQRKVI